jgi:tRNA nucleotidyltransferase (CCA-adding enzyme)
MDACPGDAILRLAGLFHDVGKPKTRAFSEKTNDYTFYDHDRVGAEIVAPICGRLRFSNDERERITHLVRHHLFHYDGWSDSAVRRWVRRVGKDRIEDLFALNEADTRAKGLGAPPTFDALYALKAHVAKVLAEGAALSTKDLAIDGHALMNEGGIERGPRLGKVLAALLEDVTNDPSLNTRERLLARAKDLLASGAIPEKA